VPLVVVDRIFGLVAMSRTGEEGFSERDFDRAKLLANFGSIALANSYTFLEAAERGDIEREAAIAAEVQRSIVPRKIPDVAGLSFGAWTEAARGVCSDYYDVVRTGPDKAIAVIGDVAGKGVAASLVMVMIRSILHLITASAKDAATLVSWVNRGISGKVDMDHYATLGLLRVDARTGEIEYSNAAHQPVLLYRRSTDAVEALDIKSIPIGVEARTPYQSRSFRLAGGDILVLYTDGVVEAMNENGKQFGRKNLGSVVARGRDLGAKELAESIREELRDYSGRARRHDDQTVLVIKAR
jgi:sigma-B regulation protein RsbU (phosphoserine phosphatase)